MSKWIKIVNDGEIDTNAFLLIGASTKRDDQSKIGFFGSGLKYSLAVLLRNQINFRVFSGVKEIKVTTRKKSFRDQTFNQIFINGRGTSLTSEMGIDWKAWFPIREVYCNALDESGAGISLVDEVVPEFDKTTFFIERCSVIDEILVNWNDYFSEKRTDVILKSQDMNVYCGTDKKYIIYRRGVQCHEEDRASLFHYDIKNIDINESRTLKHSIDAYWKVAELLAKCATKEMIRAIYDNKDDYNAESNMRWSEASFFNENWIDVIEGRRLVNKSYAGNMLKEIAKGDCLILPGALIRALKNRFKNRIVVAGESSSHGDFCILERDDRQNSMINSIAEFFNRVDIDIKKHPIDVALFTNRDIHGMAMAGRILVSVYAFSRGMRHVAETLLEEHVHIETDYKDETREMQTYLFEKLLSAYEDKSGVYL